jgi:hypothetical protein
VAGVLSTLLGRTITYRELTFEENKDAMIRAGVPGPRRDPAGLRAVTNAPRPATNREVVSDQSVSIVFVEKRSGLCVAAQGAGLPRWSRMMATASRWVSPHPAENA